MVVCDKFGRTWEGKKILWLRSTDSSRKALYKWVNRNGDRVLVYDKRHGMCDYRGIDIRDSRVELVPVLQKKNEEGWEEFPSTKEAVSFKKTLSFNGYVNNEVIVPVIESDGIVYDNSSDIEYDFENIYDFENTTEEIK